MMRAIALWVLLVLPLAGCVGDDSSERGGPQASSAAPAPPPMADEITGSIAGKVVDDERRPLQGARVLLRENSGIVESDALGNFTFNGLEGGVYTVYAERLGYVSTAKKVPVDPGLVAYVELVLEPLVVAEEPWHRSFTVSAYIHLGQAYLDYYAGWNLLTTCTKCEFYLHFPPTPEDVRFEASWAKSIGLPVISEDVYYLLRKNWNNASMTSQDNSANTRVTSGYWDFGEMPRNMEAPDHAEAITNLKNVSAMQVRIGGGFDNVAYEQRVDMWWSTAYGAKFDDEFSAFPKS